MQLNGVLAWLKVLWLATAVTGKYRQKINDPRCGGPRSGNYTYVGTYEQTSSISVPQFVRGIELVEAASEAEASDSPGERRLLVAPAVVGGGAIAVGAGIGMLVAAMTPDVDEAARAANNEQNEELKLIKKRIANNLAGTRSNTKAIAGTTADIADLKVRLGDLRKGLNETQQAALANTQRITTLRNNNVQQISALNASIAMINMQFASVTRDLQTQRDNTALLTRTIIETTKSLSNRLTRTELQNIVARQYAKRLVHLESNSRIMEQVVTADVIQKFYEVVEALTLSGEISSRNDLPRMTGALHTFYYIRPSVRFTAELNGLVCRMTAKEVLSPARFLNPNLEDQRYYLESEPECFSVNTNKCFKQTVCRELHPQSPFTNSTTCQIDPWSIGDTVSGRKMAQKEIAQKSRTYLENACIQNGQFAIQDCVDRYLRNVAQSLDTKRRSTTACYDPRRLWRERNAYINPHPLRGLVNQGKYSKCTEETPCLEGGGTCNADSGCIGEYICPSISVLKNSCLPTRGADARCCRHPNDVPRSHYSDHLHEADVAASASDQHEHGPFVTADCKGVGYYTSYESAIPDVTSSFRLSVLACIDKMKQEGITGTVEMCESGQGFASLADPERVLMQHKNKPCCGTFEDSVCLVEDGECTLDSQCAGNLKCGYDTCPNWYSSGEQYAQRCCYDPLYQATCGKNTETSDPACASLQAHVGDGFTIFQGFRRAVTGTRALKRHRGLGKRGWDDDDSDYPHDYDNDGDPITTTTSLPSASSTSGGRVYENRGAYGKKAYDETKAGEDDADNYNKLKVYATMFFDPIELASEHEKKIRSFAQSLASPNLSPEVLSDASLLSSKFTQLWSSGGYHRNLAAAIYGDFEDVAIAKDCNTGQTVVLHEELFQYTSEILRFTAGDPALAGWGRSTLDSEGKTIYEKYPDNEPPCTITSVSSEEGGGLQGISHVCCSPTVYSGATLAPEQREILSDPDLSQLTSSIDERVVAGTISQSKQRIALTSMVEELQTIATGRTTLESDNNRMSTFSSYLKNQTKQIVATADNVASESLVSAKRLEEMNVETARDIKSLEDRRSNNTERARAIVDERDALFVQRDKLRIESENLGSDYAELERNHFLGMDTEVSFAMLLVLSACTFGYTVVVSLWRCCSSFRKTSDQPQAPDHPDSDDLDPAAALEQPEDIRAQLLRQEHKLELLQVELKYEHEFSRRHCPPHQSSRSRNLSRNGDVQVSSISNLPLGTRDPVDPGIKGRTVFKQATSQSTPDLELLENKMQQKQRHTTTANGTHLHGA
jgi:hypothetical protein